MIRFILAITAISMSTVKAEDFMFQCSEPKGQSVSYGNRHDLSRKKFRAIDTGIRWEADGFSNVRPVIVWRERDPAKLLVSWGNTVPNELIGKVDPKSQFTEMNVVYRHSEHIQAFERRCGI